MIGHSSVLTFAVERLAMKGEVQPIPEFSDPTLGDDDDDDDRNIAIAASKGKVTLDDCSTPFAFMEIEVRLLVAVPVAITPVIQYVANNYISRKLYTTWTFKYTCLEK